ncbi:hypothetical protein J0687_27545, partial [Vibrio alginolyticus]|nr:hypothetical protein [Vibrio alginolyticus]
MYSQTHGRFQVPDPYWGSALSVNPQSWNRYSYAVNNAPNFIDKFGLVWLRKGNDYFWVDDKDFEKHGEIWKKN